MPEVRHHIGNLIPVAALRQPQHGEIAIPVIDLTKTAARHHVRLRQWKQGVPFTGGIGGARQHGPETINMFTQTLSCGGNILFARFGQGEVHIHKMTQIEAGLISLHTVIGQDHQRIAFGYRIGKGLLVGEELGALYIIKQRTKQDIRGLRLPGRGIVGKATGAKTKQYATHCQPQRRAQLRCYHGDSP